MCKKTDETRAQAKAEFVARLKKNSKNGSPFTVEIVLLALRGKTGNEIASILKLKNGKQVTNILGKLYKNIGVSSIPELCTHYDIYLF